MAKYYIKTLVEYWYESDNDEFASANEAEEFAWNFDELQCEVQKITVEVLPDDEEEEEEETDEQK